MSSSGGRRALSQYIRRPALLVSVVGAFTVVGTLAAWLVMPPSARSEVADTPQIGTEHPISWRAGVEPARAPARVAPEPLNAAKAPVAVKSTGQFTVVPGPAAPAKARRLVRYTVEIERGLALDPAEVAAVVDITLADKRSWNAAGYTFRRVGSGGDVRILLATPDTVDKLCAPLLTRGQVSCRNQRVVVLNHRRWMLGAPAYGTDIAAYRQYLVNHEVGHFLGHSHVGCPGPGRYAPVMLQQTLRLDGCRSNPWPALSLRR